MALERMTVTRVMELAREPFPRGHSPFTVTKNRIGNLYKLWPSISLLTMEQRCLVFTEVVRCGALDSIVFLMAHGLCDEQSIQPAPGNGPSKSETIGTPGVLTFLHQLFPNQGFNRLASHGTWMFGAFGCKYPTLEYAIHARDPLAVVRMMVFEPHSDSLTYGEASALRNILNDEERAFFTWLLRDWSQVARI